ncbi:glycosyl hydrolase [Mytilinidion resinicola]|uniref:Glycosyl hydrolase n=1 Tax=Mytilinidion resinicola TaxID=574789 RepID=A0A6A6Z0A5_9PEZI|nr:glycosyl hydrolase [Mytilinidion resinicola]KAF2814133.1 glycosyl hydrolase [Mytilinidion resinicola]
MSSTTTEEIQFRNPFGDENAPSAPSSNGSKSPPSLSSTQARNSARNSLVIQRSDDSARFIASNENSISEEKHRFRSYKLVGEYQQPWILDKRLHRTRINNYIVWGFIALGFLLSAWICFSTIKKIPKTKYCLVLSDDFQTIDPTIWNQEVQIGGFGTGSFDWTTTDSKNTYTDNKGLHIVPTLTNETTNISNQQIFDGYSPNLTRAGGDGSCTGNTTVACAVRSNATTGSIVPPKTIKYSRIEVKATLPQDDWLWPAIWMMSQASVYGPWPASGEIDILESRGNGVGYPGEGCDYSASTLHWGPTPKTDAYWRSLGDKHLTRDDYSSGVHTFGLEWSKDYIFTYLDSRLNQVLYWNFKGDRTLWQRGYFSQQTENSTLLVDPWSQTGNTNTPFAQPFYLILNVAVGGQTGWFQDGKGSKPWLDKSPNAGSDFYKKVDQWYPTWGPGDERGMTVKSVKIWQEGACG